MNTQGWLRGLMAKNMEDEKFVRHVAGCLYREFTLPVNVFAKRVVDFFRKHFGLFRSCLKKAFFQ